MAGIPFKKLLWQSDWNGDEVGYPDAEVVGCYSYGPITMYIDIEEGEILEAWFEEEDEYDD